MKKITKIDTVHAAKFGLKDVSNNFYSLIDRLQIHSEWKYPDRKWTNDVYYGIAFQWINKEKELKEKVLKLENEMRVVLKEYDLLIHRMKGDKKSNSINKHI